MTDVDVREIVENYGQAALRVRSGRDSCRPSAAVKIG
jgi:hypothetical protein